MKSIKKVERMARIKSENGKYREEMRQKIALAPTAEWL